jgi:hypothetical protein
MMIYAYQLDTWKDLAKTKAFPMEGIIEPAFEEGTVRLSKKENTT